MAAGSQDLVDKARAFAGEVSDLLNGTVTSGIRVSSLSVPAGNVLLGYNVKKSDPNPKPIPIAVGGAKPVVFLYLVQGLVLDPEGIHLTTEKSTISLYTSPDMEDDELVVGIDYVRTPSNEFPGAHLHVAGQRDDLDALYLGDERKTRKLRDLHLTVGGKRFRPTLEDLIEFVVTEEMVVPRSGWRQVIDANRERWMQRQTQANVRRNPKWAADALRAEGWTLTPPPDDESVG